MDAQLQPSFDRLLADLRSHDAQRRRIAASNLREHGSRAVAHLCRALHDSDSIVRLFAAESLGHIGGEQAIQSLISRFKSESETSVRVKIVHALGQLKSPQAIEPLCAALQEKNREVRLAAAEALGVIGEHVGSAAILEPLLKALRACFTGWRARWPFIFKGIWFSFLLLKTTSLLLGFSKFTLDDVLFYILMLCVYGLGYIFERDSQSKSCQAILESLLRIAERNPIPEIRAALPELKSIARDVVQLNRRARVTSRQTVQRIEALTEQLKKLPLPASAPAPDATVLPRIADTPLPDVKTLPRVE